MLIPLELELQISSLESPLDAQGNFVQVKGLADVVISPLPQALDGRTHLRNNSNHDDRRVGVVHLYFREQLDSRLAGQLYVQDDQRYRTGGQDVQGLLSTIRFLALVAFS